MCGIVGYIGSKEAAPILVEGLQRLEYRGYDSAGLAVLNGGIELRRDVGKISALVEDVRAHPVSGTCGIGHTRWATHGRPTEENAHPHRDCKDSLALVHNGIIENYLALKVELLTHGHRFTSDTDSEVLVHLIEQCYAGDLERAVYGALQRVQGTYAVAVVHRDHPDRIVAARFRSPMVLGMGEGENFVASDVPAILHHTRRIVYLEERDLAVLTREGMFLYNGQFQPIERDVASVDWTVLAVEKGEYPYFMVKEMWEQPKVLSQALSGRLKEVGGTFHLDELRMSPAEVARIRCVHIVACGTSYYAGMVAEYLLEELCQVPTKVHLASEFRYRRPVLEEGSLVVAISQSGETADTLAALLEAKERGAHVVAVINAVGSSISREAHSTLYIYAGPEIGVASTKAFTNTVVTLQVLTLFLGHRLGRLSSDQVRARLAELHDLPRLVDQALTLADEIRVLASKYLGFQDFLFLGRGLNYPIALEGALKVKELSYVHAEGMAAGEIKHGPIAMVDPDIPIVALATRSHTYEKLVNNLEELKARNGRIIALVSEGDTEVQAHADDVLVLPRATPWQSPVVNVIPLQLFAYYMALLRQCDVDQPRNLAKSVTVE